MQDPKRNSQKEKAFSRGNATSGAPICSGMIAFANPANSGVANISSMIVPCIVEPSEPSEPRESPGGGRSNEGRVRVRLRRGVCQPIQRVRPPIYSRRHDSTTTKGNL